MCVNYTLMTLTVLLPKALTDSNSTLVRLAQAECNTATTEERQAQASSFLFQSQFNFNIIYVLVSGVQQSG